MKNRVFKIFTVIVLVVGVFWIFFEYNKNKPMESMISESKEMSNKDFTMYRINDAGTFEKYDGITFPDGYRLDLEESYCVDTKENKIKGILSWTNGKAMVKSDKTVYCYLYFVLDADVKIKMRNGAPSNVGDTKTISCSNASWNYNWNRLDINLTNNTPIECDLSTKASPKKTLVKTLEDLPKVAISNTTPAVTGLVDEGSAGIRYEGKEPNNWVWFNNEYWRIIGLIPTKVSDDNSEERLVKIIRNDSIGGYAIRNSGNPAPWNTTLLYTLLNEYYYGRKNATGTEYCYKYSNTVSAVCDFRANGIEALSGYGKMVKEVYWNTGTVANSSGSVANVALYAYNSEKAIRTYTGKVGLMYVSDHGFASSLMASATARANLNVYNTLIQSQSNWLTSVSHEWTMTHSNTAANIYRIDIGNYPYHDPIYRGLSVRPVVHLDPRVYVVSGDGSITNPYRLGM